MSEPNLLLATPLLRANAPKTLAGYGRFRAVIDGDSALPARIKALFVAVAASTKGYPEMAGRELARGKAAGLTFAEAASGVTILCSVRGEGAALRFLALVEQTYEERVDPATPLAELAVAPGEARDNFLAYFGTMPVSLGKLVNHLPLAADAYYLMREGTLATTPIGKKHSELLLTTVIAADYHPLAAVHARGALTAGASEAELYEAILCAVPVAGLSAWVATINALEAA
ncbi:MAG: carboxymuconolactone decarboxylase family protein [Sphingomonadales bacterium]|nr:carboxymuconolactone decarboxylase family protein [Sphingomonadales bacterium]